MYLILHVVASSLHVDYCPCLVDALFILARLPGNFERMTFLMKSGILVQPQLIRIVVCWGSQKESLTFLLFHGPAAKRIDVDPTRAAELFFLVMRLPGKVPFPELRCSESCCNAQWGRSWANMISCWFRWELTMCLWSPGELVTFIEPTKAVTFIPLSPSHADPVLTLVMGRAAARQSHPPVPPYPISLKLPLGFPLWAPKLSGVKELRH